MKDISFLTFTCDQLSNILDIHSRAMFGGWGLYAGDTFFAIISDGTLYFKTSPDTQKLYHEYGSTYFQPNERQRLTSYYEVPPDILEDAETLEAWANTAIAAAREQA